MEVSVKEYHLPQHPLLFQAIRHALNASWPPGLPSQPPPTPSTVGKVTRNEGNSGVLTECVLSTRDSSWRIFGNLVEENY